jgi:hypothetical protein
MIGSSNLLMACCLIPGSQGCVGSLTLLLLLRAFVVALIQLLMMLLLTTLEFLSLLTDLLAIALVPLLLTA